MLRLMLAASCNTAGSPAPVGAASTPRSPCCRRTPPPPHPSHLSHLAAGPAGPQPLPCLAQRPGQCCHSSLPVLWGGQRLQVVWLQAAASVSGGAQPRQVGQAARPEGLLGPPHLALGSLWWGWGGAGRQGREIKQALHFAGRDVGAVQLTWHNSWRCERLGRPAGMAPCQQRRGSREATGAAGTARKPTSGAVAYLSPASGPCRGYSSSLRRRGRLGVSL